MVNIWLDLNGCRTWRQCACVGESIGWFSGPCVTAVYTKEQDDFATETVSDAGY